MASSHIAALALLAAIGSLAANGQQVFVKSDDEQGAGILRVRGEECYVVTAAHVVATPGTITVVDSKQANRQAKVVRSFARDITILTIDSAPQICSSDSWQLSSQSIDESLRRVVAGKLVRVLENGASSQIGVSVKGYDAQFITVSPLDAHDILAKGWSGSSLYVDGTLVGMLVAEKNNRGQAYRVDYIEQVIGAFFKDENAPPKPPTGEFRVLVDGELWDSVRSGVVVYDGRYSLLERVRVFEPAAKSVEIVYKVTGHDLVAAHLNFRGEPSDQGSVRGFPIQAEGSHFAIADGDEFQGVMNAIWAHMRMLKKGKGTYYLEIFDKLGRKFDLDVYQAEWSFDGNSTRISSGYSQPSTASK